MQVSKGKKNLADVEKSIWGVPVANARKSSATGKGYNTDYLINIESENIKMQSSTFLLLLNRKTPTDVER